MRISKRSMGIVWCCVSLLVLGSLYTVEAQETAWTKITPGPTSFMGRQLNPTCSGFPGTDPTFSFYVRQGSSRNLVIYFQGGGCCWNSQTCVTSPTYDPYISEADNPANFPLGIGDFDNPENPFADWSFVFIPYCTGDLHWGSGEWTYKYATGQSWTIHHRGLDNFLTALKWTKLNLPRPKKILVTGSSAGAYGAIGNFPWVRKAFPASKIYVLGDAGIEVGPREFDAQAQLLWNIDRPPWASGMTEPMYLPEFLLTQARRHPRVRFGEYGNAWDSVLTWFRSAILQSFWVATEEENVCEDYNSNVLQTLEYKQQAENYRSYLASGISHTILISPRFYTEDSAGGVSFLSWVRAMIEGGEEWQNVACSGDCDKPDPCPLSTDD